MLGGHSNNRANEVKELGSLLVGLANDAQHQGLDISGIFRQKVCHFTGHPALSSRANLWKMTSTERRDIISLAKNGGIEVKDGPRPTAEDTTSRPDQTWDVLEQISYEPSSARTLQHTEPALRPPHILVEDAASELENMRRARDNALIEVEELKQRVGLLERERDDAIKACNNLKSANHRLEGKIEGMKDVVTTIAQKYR
ncbi:hypothetical protein AOL_s00088g21 [Orbilia oligospora ATCC 24927]|uniref:Uncharacterized protein n=2 Tax=Orbilia oligospora TaxID=2813651 RepID=G1XHQ8_ARTOA|nr:hypothetical protein AOL_s00088g21 [Orbilia oligospora ATCC 24927]EGX47306.1 hypothetical protein AOL_s00088g21 [Orbilia oligospora ATCC 24927]KAF3270568.1 hypothetical protein TWF970_010771 [Orbilia oligospora]